MSPCFKKEKKNGLHFYFFGIRAFGRAAFILSLGSTVCIHFMRLLACAGVSPMVVGERQDSRLKGWGRRGVVGRILSG